MTSNEEQMNFEIERKFLVVSEDFKRQSHQKSYIKQGFLNSHEERTVRIRISDEKGLLTIKGKSNLNGTSRFEWEKEVLLDEAKQLLLLCEEGIIEKNRYYVQSGDHMFEIDEFLGANKGLLIAEVELENEQEFFEKPSWLGKEVTGVIKYYNSRLSKHPFKNWKRENLNRD